MVAQKQVYTINLSVEIDKWLKNWTISHLLSADKTEQRNNMGHRHAEKDTTSV